MNNFPIDLSCSLSLKRPRAGLNVDSELNRPSCLQGVRDVVFRYDGASGTWTEDRQLINSDGTTYDRLGMGVALNINLVVAGAPGAYHDGKWTGVTDTFVLDPPAPDIKVNGQDDDFSAPQGTPLTLTLSLDPASRVDNPYDWGIVAAKNSVSYFWWRWPGNWINSPLPRRVLQIGLIPVNGYPLATNAVLPAATWTFAFALGAMNNSYEGSYQDSITVTLY